MPRRSEDIPMDPANRAATEQPRAPQRSETVLADEAAIDEAIEMTFPASDPPAWTSSHTHLTSDIEPDATGDR
jgi:hypothetical protein